jgi:putative transposase
MPYNFLFFSLPLNHILLRMPDYTRVYRPGGSYFFTLVTEGRAPILCDAIARRLLHEAIDICRRKRPFTLDAIVLLPDHLHAMWTLPEGDEDFSARWSTIKASFTHAYLQSHAAEQPLTPGRQHYRRRGVWQPRFWEHLIRDQEDFNRHLDYIHYNPVKHGLSSCPHAWEFSTFRRWVDLAGYEPDWQCFCNDRSPTPPQFRELAGMKME